MSEEPKLPPLPEPFYKEASSFGWPNLFTADQMRAYAIAALKAREQPTASMAETAAFEAWADANYKELSRIDCWHAWQGAMQWMRSQEREPETVMDEWLRNLGFELDGVITDVEQGDGFDDVCLETVKRVWTALAFPPVNAK